MFNNISHNKNPNIPINVIMKLISFWIKHHQQSTVWRLLCLKFLIAMCITVYDSKHSSHSHLSWLTDHTTCQSVAS